MVDFVFDDMGDDSMVLLPFSDGEYRWSTYMLTREQTENNPDIQCFQNHVLEWMNGIKEGKIQR